MKLNITRSDGTVRFTLDTKFFTNALLLLLILPISFFVVWSLAPPPFFYDIAVTTFVTIKLYRFILESRKPSTYRNQ
jgi:hypothetical protein